jgi:hypothetical protein
MYQGDECPEKMPRGFPLESRIVAIHITDQVKEVIKKKRGAKIPCRRSVC